MSYKSVFHSWQRGSIRICCGAAAADRRPAGHAAVDQRAHSSKPAAAGWDRQTDGRPTDAQTHACYAEVPVISYIVWNYTLCRPTPAVSRVAAVDSDILNVFITFLNVFPNGFTSKVRTMLRDCREAITIML